MIGHSIRSAPWPRVPLDRPELPFTDPRERLRPCQPGLLRTGEDGSITVDPGDGGRSFTVARDFTARALQGNAVLRWEYRPGSALFLVWQQQRSGLASDK